MTTTMNMTTMTLDPVPPGTRVLNTTDGEPGTVLSATAFDQARGWTEYEVVVGSRIEVWRRDHFVLFAEIEVTE